MGVPCSTNILGHLSSAVISGAFDKGNELKVNERKKKKVHLVKDFTYVPYHESSSDPSKTGILQAYCCF